MLRIGLVTDVHYAEKDPAGGRHYRDSRIKMKEAVEFFRRGKLDAVVHLGDLVDTPEKPDPDKEMGFAALMAAMLEPAARERFTILGNHCVQSVSKGRFLKAFGQRKSYFSVDRNGVHLVFLDACFRKDAKDYDAGNFAWNEAEIPAAEREWLEKDLAATKLPKLVFCHQRLDEPKNLSFAVASRTEVRGILSRTPGVLGVFQGHNHENDVQVIDGVRYVTLQAMVEGAGIRNNAFSILEVGDGPTLRLEGYRQHKDHPFAALGTVKG